MLSGASRKPSGGARPASEDLSEAELRVVRFLPSNLKAPEIAAELFVSPNTVRTHLRHIYAKLDAHSRAEAVGAPASSACSRPRGSARTPASRSTS